MNVSEGSKLLVLQLLVNVQVEKVRIDYAKTSKKIDVKKLKTRMWDFISDTQQQEETHEQQDRSSAKDTETTMVWKSLLSHPYSLLLLLFFFSPL